MNEYSPVCRGQVLEEQNEISDTLSQLITVWMHTIVSLNEHLFNGSDVSIKLLGTMMADGQLLERGDPVSDPDIQQFLERSIFGILIPDAWALGQAGVFVADSGAPCGTPNPYNSNDMDDDTAQATRCCVDGKLYFLVATYGDDEDCSGGGDEGVSCLPNPVSSPEGIEKLKDGTWGVGLTDFVIGCVCSLLWRFSYFFFHSFPLSPQFSLEKIR